MAIKAIINNTEKEIEQIKDSDEQDVDYVYSRIGDTEVEGEPPISIKSIGGNLADYRIYGNTVGGESAGDLVESGEHAGEYKVPVTVEGKNLFDEEYTDITDYHSDSVVYKAYYVGYGTFTLSSTIPRKVTCNLFLLSGNVISGASSLTNGVWAEQSQTVQSINGYITIGYRNSNNIDPQNYNTMLNAGSTPLPYEPYHAPVTTSIYLPEPIKMVGDEAEYIDYSEQKLHRIGAEDIDVTLPALSTIKGTNTLSVNTSIQPSNIYVKDSFDYKKVFTATRAIEDELPLNYRNIEDNDSTLDNYRIYGNTVGGESVGDRTGNLFDFGEWSKNINANGDNILAKGIDSITITANSNDAFTEPYAYVHEGVYKIYVKPNTNYLLSWVSNNNLYGRVFIFKNGAVDGSHRINVNNAEKKYLLFDTDTNTEFVTLRFGVSNAGDSITYSKIMLIEGSTALPYEPYGYKIPVTLTADSAETTDIYLDEPLKKGRIYGFHIDPSVSDSSNAVTYIADAVGKTPAAMGANTFSFGDWENAFFMPKPCMLKSDGTVDYYLNPNDYTKKADGTPSDVANANYDGNAMMEWSKIWYKFVPTETEGEVSFYVADYKADNDFECWCNIDSQNNETDHFYTAIYNGTGTSKLRSISGVALTSANGNGGTTVTQEVERATANNTTNNVEWYTEVYSDRMLINMLLVLMGKSLNSQAVYGRGLDTGGQAEKEAYMTGALNDKGLFWGDISVGTSGVKVFGMENYWGCVWHRTAGFISIDNHAYAKLTYSTADGSSAAGYNRTGNGYLDFGSLPNTNGWIKTMKYNSEGFIPSAIDGTNVGSNYYGDYYYQSSQTRYLLIGGRTGGSDQVGSSDFVLSNTSLTINWNISTTLSCKPMSKGSKPHTHDYIDYATQKRHNSDGTESSVTLPEISTLSGTNTLTVGTEVQPSNVYIKGKIKEIN